MTSKFSIDVTEKCLIINKTHKIHMSIYYQNLLIVEYERTEDKNLTALGQIRNILDAQETLRKQDGTRVNLVISGLPDMHVGYTFPIGTVISQKSTHISGEYTVENLNENSDTIVLNSSGSICEAVGNIETPTSTDIYVAASTDDECTVYDMNKSNGSSFINPEDTITTTEGSNLVESSNDDSSSFNTCIDKHYNLKKTQSEIAEEFERYTIERLLSDNFMNKTLKFTPKSEIKSNLIGGEEVSTIPCNLIDQESSHQSKEATAPQVTGNNTGKSHVSQSEIPQVSSTKITTENITTENNIITEENKSSTTPPKFKDLFISPEGVGYDINCGVRALRTNLKYSKVKDRIPEIIDRLDELIPSGTGKSKIKVNQKQMKNILTSGISSLMSDKIVLRKNKTAPDGSVVPDEVVLQPLYNNIMDYSKVEDCGSLELLNPEFKQNILGKGIQMLGTLGSGNHYLEIQRVERTFNKTQKEFEAEEYELSRFKADSAEEETHESTSPIAEYIPKNKFNTPPLDAKELYDLEEDDLVIFIHCGSRGLGHEICNNFTGDGELFLSMNEPKGMEYFDNMNAAANYAFVNREVISMVIKHVLEEMFPLNNDSTEINTSIITNDTSSIGDKSCVSGDILDWSSSTTDLLANRVAALDLSGPKDASSCAKITIISDCGHNIAKMESIDGFHHLVHRKGASRAHPGDLVAVGGSMDTCSYLLLAMETKPSFYSICHGSGRMIRRSESHDLFKYDDVMKNMRGIELRTENKKDVVEESGQCYKSIDDVVDHCEKVGLVRKISRNKPVAVIKG